MSSISSLTRRFQTWNGANNPTMSEDHGEEERDHPIVAFMSRHFGRERSPFVTFTAAVVILFILAVIGQSGGHDHISSSPSPPVSTTVVPVVDQTSNIVKSTSPDASQDVTSQHQDSKIHSSTSRHHTSMYPMVGGLLVSMCLFSCLVHISRVLRYQMSQQRRALSGNSTRNFMEQILRLSAMMRNSSNNNNINGRAGQPSNIASIIRLAMLNRDFNGNDYEILQQLDATTRSRGASESAIQRLPVHIITAEDCQASSSLANSDSSDTAKVAISSAASLSSPSFSSQSGSSNSPTQQCSDRWTCSICLAAYEPGDRVKTTACMHRFHADCIDTWLRQNSICPVCKFDGAV